MKYIYYKSHKGNFGDDLNAWMWPKFFGEHQENSKNAFLGIGSILFNDFPLIKQLTDERKIVFGTGIRLTHDPLKIDESWDIKFLRGPLSAIALGNKYEYIADAAYAIRLLPEFEEIKNTPKKYKVSVFPYFKSLNYLDWEKLCKELGFNYISPESKLGVEHTLREIAASEYIITEAMHGAILADILRVPWHRFILSTPVTEGSMVAEFKWLDWLASIGQQESKSTFIKFYRKTKINKFLRIITNERVNVEFLSKFLLKKEVSYTLKTVTEFYMSKDADLTNIDKRIHAKINELINQLSLNE